MGHLERTGYRSPQLGGEEQESQRREDWSQRDEKSSMVMGREGQGKDHRLIEGNTRSEGWKGISRGIPGHQSTIRQKLELGYDQSTFCVLCSECMWVLFTGSQGGMEKPGQSRVQQEVTDYLGEHLYPGIWKYSQIHSLNGASVTPNGQSLCCQSEGPKPCWCHK